MYYRVTKRLADFCIAATLLLFLLPIILLLALLIRLDSPGSPFFLQTRTGKDNNPFRIVKFRTMVQDAETKGPDNTAQNDPRITRLGKFLRHTSIDELPQLWNVLVGEMSLIGPRPHLPRQESEYTPEQWQERHRLRPGITGLAQVNGRSQLSFKEQIGHDLKYVREVSMMLDLHILWRTVWVVLQRTGTN